uniref:IP17058p n=1 Tax=Drosophila melanogaster TaxID=7227 RepID=A2VEG9_DROME|nr:IP17058p [Drosophila melanogaster]
MLVEVPLQAQEGLGHHIRLVAVALEALLQHVVVKLGDLQEIAEYDILVVPHGARHHRLVDALDVLLHHVEQIPGELLLSFHQLPENG